MPDTQPYGASLSVVGKTYAGHRFLEEIGRGGMGVVYRGVDEKLDRKEALKLLFPHLASDQAFLRQFAKEARALARLRHNNIVAVYSFQETEVGSFIAMEFVQGVSLADRIKTSGKMTFQEVFSLFVQILQALEHAHTAGVFHRDLKPSNILISNDNEPKISDFGLAKIQRAGSTTVTQVLGGSLYYCPPEQLDGLGEPDQRGDVYSIGMTLYEALTGSVPFEDTDSDFRIREKIVKGKIRPPVEQRPDVPPCLNDIVMKAIAQRPDRRFQSARDMRSALEQCSASQISAGHNPSRPKVSKSVLYVLGSLLVAVLAYLVIQSVSFHDEFRPEQHSNRVPPAIPSGLRATADARSKKIWLDWIGSRGKGESGLMGYRVYRNGTEIATTRLTAFIDTNIIEGTRYCYAVVAFDSAAGVSPASDSACTALVSAVDSRPPSVPLGLTAKALETGNKIRLTWQASNDPTGLGVGGYYVYRDYAKIQTTTSTSCIDANVLTEKNYRYAVAAYDNSGHVSEKSEPVFVMLPRKPVSRLLDALLIVETNPPTAAIWINGAKQDQNQVFKGKAGVGYFVSVEAGTHRYQDSVRLKEGENKIPVDFTHTVQLTIRSYDASHRDIELPAHIFVDGIRQCNSVGVPLSTPVRVEVSVGLHRVNVMKDGFETTPVTKNLRQSDSLSFALRRLL